MPSLPHIGRGWLIAAILAVCAIAAAGTAHFVLSSEPGNVSNPDVEFVATAPPVQVEPVAASKFSWPVYGYNKARTRYLPINGVFRPPFKRGWRSGGSILLEFPPVICGDDLFLLKNTASLFAFRRKDGYVRWRRTLGRLAASSPACGGGTVYATILQRGASRNSGGRIVAVSSRTGKLRWSRSLPARTESSPLLHRGRVYFGSEDGRVYALDAKTGKDKWVYRAGGAVKGGIAMDNGRLYFGDYAGQVTALDRATGAKVWSSSIGGSGPLGSGAGNLYATAAVAYGRVYIGSTNGFVYSFSARTGKLAWRHQTGSYVYASPAVGPAKGGTVYVGSYTGTFYALNARSGAVRWSRGGGGKISGGAVVLGDVVLYSNLGKHTLSMVSASSGRLIWSQDNGGFDPGIADGKDMYLMGYSMLQNWRER